MPNIPVRQTVHNLLFFLAVAYLLWLCLMLIEIFTGYSGAFIQIVYGISFFALFVLLSIASLPLFRSLTTAWLGPGFAGLLGIVLLCLFYVVSLWTFYVLKQWLG